MYYLVICVRIRLYMDKRSEVFHVHAIEFV